MNLLENIEELNSYLNIRLFNTKLYGSIAAYKNAVIFTIIPDVIVPSKRGVLTPYGSSYVIHFSKESFENIDEIIPQINRIVDEAIKMFE